MSEQIFEKKLSSNEYLNLMITPSQFVVIDAFKTKKSYVLKASVKNGEDIYEILLIDNAVGLLADFIGMNRMVLKNLLKNTYNGVYLKNKEEKVNILNSAIHAVQQKMKVDSHMYMHQWYAFNIATEIHHTITFNEIKKEFGFFFPNYKEEKDKRDNSINLTYAYRNMVTEYDKVDLIVFCNTGKNNKSSAIHVSIQCRVASCMNSIIALDQKAVKHTENWRERLQEQLKFASDSIESIASVIERTQKPISIEEGYSFIDEMKFSLRDEQKIKTLKDVLKKRFNTEYQKNKTAWSLSQSLSFMGTYLVKKDYSDFVADTLMQQSFNVLLSYQQI